MSKRPSGLFLIKMKKTINFLYNLFSISFYLFFASAIIYAFSKGGFNRYELETYTLSNGEKTIVFQTMMHIGLKSFYYEVGKEMNHYGDNGYTVFLESYGDGDVAFLNKNDPDYENKYLTYQENIKKIIEIYTKIENEMYSNTDYIEQNIILDRYSRPDYKIADISQKELNDKIVEKNNKKFFVSEKNDEDEAEKSTSERYKSLSLLIRYPTFSTFIYNLNSYRPFNYLIVSIEKIEDYIFNSNFTQDVIMDYRNQKVFEAITSEENNKIYIQYGSAHFDGIYDLLKKSDPNWHIINTTYKTVTGKAE